MLILSAVILVAAVLGGDAREVSSGSTKGKEVYEVKVYPVVSCGNPDVVFAYTFDSHAGALAFARTVAHQGLERNVTTSRGAVVLILYPTIRRIKVRLARRGVKRWRQQ